jgi:hypothetical protein
MWETIESEAFGNRAAGLASPPATVSPWRRWGVAAAIAASLVLGIVGGRWSVTRRLPPLVTGEAGASTGALSARNSDPYQRTTEEFLSRSVVLLASLPAEDATAGNNDRFVAQASQLLTTTRVLLDSPVGTDRRMKELLQDLELVLAQVARIQAPRHRAELTLITEALQERDLVPRMRSAVADLSLSDH